MAKRVKDLMKWLETQDPESQIWWTIWDKDSILASYDTDEKKFQPTEAEIDEILNGFGESDYFWETIQDDFSDSCSNVIGEFICSDCRQLDRKAKVLNNQTYCSDCGEEKEVVY
jgi:formylmethanofuran dehydrogenase subunit E